MPPPDMLMEIALVGLFSGFVEEAGIIFAVLERLYPQSALPWIGRGLILLRCGNPHGAVECVRRALRLEPGSDLARSFLVFCLDQAGEQEEACVLGAGMRRQGSDPSAMELVNRILDRQFLS